MVYTQFINTVTVLPTRRGLRCQNYEPSFHNQLGPRKAQTPESRQKMMPDYCKLPKNAPAQSAKMIVQI